MKDVLLIDKNIDKTILKILRENFNVYTSNSGQDGFERFVSIFPDIIFINPNIEDVNVIDFTNMVKKLDEQIPIILIFDKRERIDYKFINNFSDYIVKTSDILRLKFHLNKIMQFFEKNNELIGYNEKLESILWSIPDITTVVDANGKILSFYSQEKNKTKYKKEDYINKTLDELYPEHKDKFMDVINKVLEKNEQQCIDFTLEINGSLAYKNTTLTKLENDKILAITKDISNVKKQEHIIAMQKDELVDNYKKIKAVLNSIPDVIIIFDQHYLIEDILVPKDNNDDVLHFKSSKGKHLNELFDHRNNLAQIIKNNIDDALFTNEVIECEYVISNNNEVCNYYHAKIVNMDNTHVLMVLRNITNQKLAEKQIVKQNQQLEMLNNELDAKVQQRTAELQLTFTELKESKEQLEAIISAMLDPVIIINEKGEIEYINKATLILFNYEENEMIGKNVHNLLCNNKQLMKAKKGFNKFIDTNKGNLIGKITEIEAKKSDGESFYAEISLSTFTKNNKPYSVGIIRDITERKKAEKKIQKELNDTRKELEEAKFSKLGDILSDTADDIRKSLQRLK